MLVLLLLLVVVVVVVVVALVLVLDTSVPREEGERQGRTIGIYPEIKNAFATNRILAGRGDSRRLEEYVLEELAR